MGKVGYSAMPQHIFLAAHHAQDVWLEVLVVSKRHGVTKLVIALYVGKAVFLPVFGVAGALEKIAKLLALNCHGLKKITLHMLELMNNYKKFKTALPAQQNTKKAAPKVNEYLAQPVKCYFIVTPRWGSVLLPRVGWTGNYQPLVCVRV